MSRFTRFASAMILGAASFALITRSWPSSAHAEATYSLASPAARFIIRNLPVGKSYYTYRIDTTSGDSWTLDAGKWVKLTDATPPGPGVYDLQLIPLDPSTFQAVRMDLATGREWYLSYPKWIQFTEP